MCTNIHSGKNRIYNHLYPIVAESKAPNALNDVIMEYGVPNYIHSDNAQVKTGVEWTHNHHQYFIKGSMMKPYHPEQNQAERMIDLLKNRTNYIMDKSKAPEKCWNYVIKAAAEMINHTATRSNNWEFPQAITMGDMPDISLYLNFEFYEKIVYLDCITSFLEMKEKPDGVLGRAKSVGDAMTYYVLTESSTVIQHSVLCSVEYSEMEN